MITVEIAPTPIPTAAGWVRRQRSETIVPIPTTMATTRSQGGCSSHVVASVAEAIANEIRYIAASTTRSRAAADLVGGVDDGRRQRGVDPAGEACRRHRSREG